MFEAKINKNENKIEIFNVSEFDFSRVKLSNPIEVKPKEYDPKLKDLGLNSLIPTDDGEDFIFTFVSTNFLDDKFYAPKTLIGRRYTELFPFAKNSVEWYKKVYETGKKETIYIYFYENGSLVSCLEHKIVLWDDELVIFMEDKSDLIQVKSQKSPFEVSSLPKILVKENNAVKVNKAYESLVDARKRNIDKFTLEDLDNNEILYNDLNLDLSVSDIIKKLFNGEHYQIGYNMKMLTSKDKYSIVHGIARIINYDGEHAVEFIILKELLGDELELTLASDMNLDTIQEFTKSGFLYYNIKNNTFSWGKGIEDILEGPVPLDFNLIDVLDEITINNDVFKSGVSIDDISADNPQIKTDYKIKTFKGNVKYLNCVIKGIIEDDELTKLLYFFRDITDDVLRNYDLLSLRDTINDVETATSIGISYEDAEGKHHWTPGFYDIIERDPKDEDKYKNLFKDYMDSNDFNRIEELVKNLEPNEYLGDQIVPIYLDNDKTKYIKLNLRKIYDNKGNFVRISESTMDVTDEVLRDREIAELNATVEDVQSASGKPGDVLL